MQEKIESSNEARTLYLQEKNQVDKMIFNIIEEDKKLFYIIFF